MHNESNNISSELLVYVRIIFPAYDELFPSCQPKSKETVTTATNYIQVHIVHMSTYPIQYL